MICPTCNTETSHIKLIADKIGCHSCMGFAETGGTKTDKILTRSAERILEQQVQNEGDMIAPYIVDKSTNQVTVNQDFVDKYPDQAANTFTPDELTASGNEGLKPVANDDTGEEIVFRGSEEEAIKEIVDDVQ